MSALRTTPTIPEYRRVADAMIHWPKVLEPTARAAQVRDFFTDDHVHAALVVAGERLLSVIERDDLPGVDGAVPAARIGRLDGRTVPPHAPLGLAMTALRRAGRRRLAVIDSRQQLLGLLCLKRSGTGFCSDDDVAARALESTRRSGDRTGTQNTDRRTPR